MTGLSNGASQVAQWKRICLSMQETREMRVWSLGWEDLLEEEMATYSGILAWEIPWLRRLAVYIPWGHKESNVTEQLSMHKHIHTHTQPCPICLPEWLLNACRAINPNWVILRQIHIKIQSLGVNKKFKISHYFCIACMLKWYYLDILG